MAVTTGAITCAKLRSDHYHQLINTQLFYRQIALPAAQPSEGRSMTFHELARPWLTRGLSKLVFDLWLPCGGSPSLPAASLLLPVRQ